MRNHSLLVAAVLVTAPIAAFGLAHPQTQTSRPTAPPGSGAPGLPPEPPPRSAQPQQPAGVTGTGIIRGRVLRSDTGRPLAKVRVGVRAAGLQNLPVVATDANGRYELKALPPARYTVSASRGGFVPLEFGQRRPTEPGRPIELADGQVVERIDISLPAGGVIAGRVLDDAGEPLAGAVVAAMRQRFVQGVRQLDAVAQSPDVTDDLGQFRVYGIPPGTYFLSASVSGLAIQSLQLGIASGGSAGDAGTFYPGTLSLADAQPVHIDAGSEMSGLVFPLVPARTATISGAVRAADGRPPAEANIQVGQLRNGGVSTRGTAMRADGSFSVPNLTPGRYTLAVRLPPGNDQIAVAEVTLDDADIIVPLVLRKGDATRGRVTADAGAAPQEIRPNQVRIFLDVVDSAQATLFSGNTVRDDWTFESTGLVGRRRFRVTVPQGWAVSSIRYNGRDITDATVDFAGKDLDDVEIRLTRRLTTVSGFVSDVRGQAVTAATVVLFAEDSERWRPGSRFLRAVRPDQNGRFNIQGLPPARYMAVALDFLEAGEETNPETLEELSRAGTRVTLGEGAVATVDLKVVVAAP